MLAGNSHASIKVLELLLEIWAPEDILVIGPPGGPKHPWQPSLAAHAVERHVPVLDPDDVNEQPVVDTLAAHGTDLLLSVYYTQLFRAPLLEAVDGLAVNFHPSLLPRHRGTAPLIWAIAEGDTMTGVSTHLLTLGVDTGPLLWQRPLPIHPNDTGYSLHLKASALVTATAAEMLRRLVHGRPLPEPVEQFGPASQHTSRDPQLNRLDWYDPAERIRNVVRALASPMPGAHTTWNGTQIGLERLEVLSTPRTSRPAGMIELDGEGFLVWAADAPLHIHTIRHEGRVRPGSELRHLGVTEGDLFI